MHVLIQIHKSLSIAVCSLEVLLYISDTGHTSSNPLLSMLKLYSLWSSYPQSALPCNVLLVEVKKSMLLQDTSDYLVYQPV